MYRPWAAFNRSPCASSCKIAARQSLGKLQVARGQSDLGFGNYASCTRHRLLRAESADRTSQQKPGARKIAKLGHRNAPKCQRRSIVAQCDPLEGPEGITGRQRATSGGNQRIHDTR